MATVATTEDITKLVQYINSYRDKIVNDSKEAKSLLHAAGIHTMKGTLKKQYRSK
jgi:hypothetical protein